MEAMKVEAKVITVKHPITKNNFKQFQIINANMDSHNCKLIQNAANTNDIQSIRFDACTFAEFPRAQILLGFVKNLTSVAIRASNLTQITGDNLRGLGSLKELYLSFNSIETLPKGLFVHTPNLEMVSFYHNRIKEIDENILDGLNKLKFFCLLYNLKINVRFDTNGNVTLAQLKQEIRKCRPTEEIVNDLREKNAGLTIEFETLRKEFDEMKTAVSNMNEMSKKEIAELKTNCAKLTAELNQLKSTNVKPFDFTIVVNGKNFRVNKDALIANSPVLAKLIGENHDADRLVLRDISEETFEEILKFMMTKNPPREAANLIELYAASARLEMKDLMELTAEILMDKVNPENALDVMNVCKKFNHKELSKKALIELNKKFAEQ